MDLLTAKKLVTDNARLPFNRNGLLKNIWKPDFESSSSSRIILATLAHNFIFEKASKLFISKLETRLIQFCFSSPFKSRHPAYHGVQHFGNPQVRVLDGSSDLLRRARHCPAIHGADQGRRIRQ